MDSILSFLVPIILVVLAALVVFLFRSCMSAGTAILSGAYLPSTASVQDLVVSVSGNGAIEPIRSYRVTTLVRGEVLEAPFEEGGTVQEGDLLFRIDSTDVETAIEQAQLSLETARLNYQQLLKDQEDSQKNATVKATATGVITELYVDEGDIVSAGSPIADILDRENMKLKVVTVGEDGYTLDDVLTHDAHQRDTTLHSMLAAMKYPDYPVALGVIRAVEDATVYDREVARQVEEVKAQSKIHSVDELLHSGATWEIE